MNIHIIIFGFVSRTTTYFKDIQSTLAKVRVGYNALTALIFFYNDNN